jgi:hypothetical protein
MLPFSAWQRLNFLQVLYLYSHRIIDHRFGGLIVTFRYNDGNQLPGFRVIMEKR